MNISLAEISQLESIEGELKESLGSLPEQIDEIQVNTGCGGCHGTQIQCAVPTESMGTLATSRK